MGGGVRADGIPADVRKTIQTIKEIAGSYSDEEIYAMLKESNMDPNETAQKLLSQDPFHEVKRKRDKKKENAINRDSGDVRAKSGNQGRGGRFGTYLDQGAGRGSYLPSYNSLGFTELHIHFILHMHSQLLRNPFLALDEAHFRHFI
eukprot:Gb_18524 [translate_table: standard]